MDAGGREVSSSGDNDSGNEIEKTPPSSIVECHDPTPKEGRVLSNTDFPLKEWQAAGLNVASGVKAQLATVEERLVAKIIGTLSPAEGQTLNERVRNWLQL